MPNTENKGLKDLSTDESTDAVGIRIDEIVNIILENPVYITSKTSDALVKHIAENFKFSIRQAQRYVAKARSRLRSMTKEKTEKNLQRALIERRSLLLRARKEGELKTELLTLKDIAELQNLYPDKNVNVKGSFDIKNVDMSKITEHGLERLKRGDEIEVVLSDPKSVKPE